MEKRIILARHAETLFNRVGVIMGRTDSVLSPQGEETVRALGRVLQGEGVQAVFCSPLGRAYTSARIYMDTQRNLLSLRPGLAELACGDWEGLPRYLVKPNPGLLRSSWTDKPPNGESYQDAEPRVHSVIQELRRVPYSPVLVVGHAGINRVFLKLWLGLTSEEAIKIRCPHDAFFILDETGSVSTKWVNGEESHGLLYER